VLLPSKDLRTGLQASLADAGIETLIHYPIPMPDQKASAPSWSDGRDFPRARKFCETVLSLPCHPDLSDAQVETVTAAVLAWSRQH
jgi:dTDP-4-amino-4,6-dideoxygalactose transaminase